MGAILLGLFVFARISGLLMALPMFNTQGVPKYVLVLSAVGLTVVLAPLVPMIDLPSSFGMLIVSIGSEVMLGVMMGRHSTQPPACPQRSSGRLLASRAHGWQYSTPEVWNTSCTAD